MKNITVIFHDDAQNPAEGVREAVKQLAADHGAQHTEVDPNKATISGGNTPAIWMDLQPIAPIQVSHDGTAEEHAGLLKALKDAQDAAPKKGKDKGKQKDAA